jgi:Tol biopolymer transport system component
MKICGSGSRLAALLVILCTSSSAQTTTRVSVDSSGAQANWYSEFPSISADGRYVAFESVSTNLVAGDTNGHRDVFLHDRHSGTTERVSVSSGGVQGNADSYSPSISADGRFVAFYSYSTNLVADDTNGFEDVFVRDRLNGTTELVSVSSGGELGNNESYRPSISANGRFVAFTSDATNLVAGDTNGEGDIFVRDRQSGTTERVSVSSDGTEANSYSDLPAISADGRYVAFYDFASNLVPGDMNGQPDIFVRDRQSQTTERVSVSSSGVEGNSYSFSPSISADGRYVAFNSDATNLVPGDTNGFWDVFVHDRQTGTTERVSVSSSGTQGDSLTFWPSISADGRFVAFASGATNLVPGDTNGDEDVFVHDRQTGTTERVSISNTGAQGNGNTSEHGNLISADGRCVAFTSESSNLVMDDTNNWEDVFVRDRGAASAFTAFCFGDGSITACPCNNSGQIAHGCENSAGTGGAVLNASGEASVSSSTVQLESSGELLSAISIAFQGNAAIAPVLFGDGLRCLGGTLLRLYIKSAVGGSITAPEAGDPPIPLRSAVLGDPIPLGASRFYHVYYRDERASFCPAPLGDRFNVTNAIAVSWGA